MNDTARLQQKPVEIEFSGDLTIGRAAELKIAVTEALAGAETLVIRLHQPLSFDLSFVQILCALHRSTAQLGKKTFLLGDVPVEMAAMLRQAGFRPEDDCVPERGEACLWQLAA